MARTVSFKVFRGTLQGIQETITERKIGPDEVLVKITHSGLCYTDIHYKTSGQVLGHEGVGVVEELGESVINRKKGDRVGWGFLHSTCGHCKQCLRGFEPYCPDRQMFGTSDFDQGSLGSHAVWKSSFLFSIPDGMSSSDAGPFMCAGATVWGALKEYSVQPGDRVGIVGNGGLGHLAIQFAAKMGCEVVVFSSTEDKRAEALALGAHEFYATKGVSGEVLKASVANKIDHLLVTSAANPDWAVYLDIMAPCGSIYPLTVDHGNLTIPHMPFMCNGIRLQGSILTPRQSHREMLRFAAMHGIKPLVNKFPMTVAGINEAMDILEAGKMRYRGVLVAPGAD